MKLLTMGAFGMTAICYILSWKLLYGEASSAVAIYCFGPQKTHFISNLIERTVIDITQIDCPPIAEIILPSTS
jgi:hypothetical protein